MPKIVVSAQLLENYTSKLEDSRGHSIISDIKKESGGDDKGPSALELGLMSLAGCAVTIFIDIAKESKVEISNLKVVAEAEKSENKPLIDSVKLKVNVTTKAREQLVNAIWRRTEAMCPVAVIFREKIPINVELKVTKD